MAEHELLVILRNHERNAALKIMPYGIAYFKIISINFHTARHEYSSRPSKGIVEIITDAGACYVVYFVHSEDTVYMSLSNAAMFDATVSAPIRTLAAGHMAYPICYYTSMRFYYDKK